MSVVTVTWLSFSKVLSAIFEKRSQKGLIDINNEEPIITKIFLSHSEDCSLRELSAATQTSEKLLS